MEVKACRTHVVKPGEEILEVLDAYFPSVEERTVIAITSKVISVCANRIVPKESISKPELIRREADAYLESDNPLAIAIKNGLLMPAAGIDESNCEGGYILFPENIQADAVRIWKHLKKKHRIKELGIIITDSHVTPLRRGVTGIALGWCGFVPLYNYVGRHDLFGRPLNVTVSSVLDALASAAVLTMGEGDEQTPIALIKNAPKMTFVDRIPSGEEIAISIEEDLYAPILKAVSWKKNRSFTQSSAAPSVLLS